MAATKDLVIVQGKTFTLILRWEVEPIVRKAVSGVSFATGAPRITAVSHGIPDGWRGVIYGVKGPKLLNAENNPPRDVDYHEVTVIDADTIEFNGLNPYDEQGGVWPAYVSGGFLQYFTPMDLTGQTPRMQIKDKPGGTVLASSLAGDAPLDIIDFAVDTAAKTIKMTIAASSTDDITSWTRGAYELEMVSNDVEPTVVSLLTGRVSVVKEVTT